MSIKQKFGRIFKKLKNIFTQLQPRYQLSLDSNTYDLNSKQFKYIFKAYGEHSFVTITFNEIKNNDQLLYNIHPKDLITISINENIYNQKKSMLRISEILRDNKFLITDNDSYQIFDGDEICDNALLIERINNIDLYKIAYNTGFCRGRSLTKMVKSQCAEPVNNLVNLNVVKK